jgi:hypothetical protein
MTCDMNPHEVFENFEKEIATCFCFCSCFFIMRGQKENVIHMSCGMQGVRRRWVGVPAMPILPPAEALCRQCQHRPSSASLASTACSSGRRILPCKTPNHCPAMVDMSIGAEDLVQHTLGRIRPTGSMESQQQIHHLQTPSTPCDRLRQSQAIVNRGRSTLLI